MDVILFVVSLLVVYLVGDRELVRFLAEAGGLYAFLSLFVGVVSGLRSKNTN